MNSKYDIFKKTDNSVAWVEAVEDIVAAKKGLISLSTSTPGAQALGFVSAGIHQSHGRMRLERWEVKN
jgi:hypothetical protein